jgi:hypothetical protein
MTEMPYGAEWGPVWFLDISAQGFILRWLPTVDDIM